MKAYLNTKNVQFEVEGKNQKELFKSLAEVQEVFSEEVCGLCGGNHLKFSVRTVDDNDYYEMLCGDCWARLKFGQSKKGDKLFAVRKLDKSGKPDRENGQYGKHNGWHKYVKSNNNTDDSQVF